MSIYIIIGVAVVFGIIFFISNLPKEKYGAEKKEEDGIGTYFTLKKYFFTQSEKTFFNELVKQNNNQYTILSKVRLEDIVSAKKSLDWKEKGIKRNYIKSKHLDFVILDNHYGNILAVIELDGKSHNTDRQGKYDKIKDDILNSVGCKFYRVKAGEDYAQSIHDVLNNMTRA